MWFLLILILALPAAHFGVKRMAAAIRAQADPYPLSVLSAEPQGEEVFITTADGTRIRTLSAGDGPTVVLAHGYAVSLLEWNVIWSMLRDMGCRVIAFDQRGHGKSTIGTEGVGSRQMANDYCAVLEHYDVRDAILIGHSMGGFIAQVFMLTHPEIVRDRLKGAILFATFAGNVLQGAPQNRVQIPLIRSGILPRLANTDYGWPFGASLIGKPPSPAMIAAFLQDFSQHQHQATLPILEAFGQEDYYHRLGEIPVPCVVICGTEDHTTPQWHSQKLGQLIPQARNVWVEGKGHLLNWEAPQSLIDAVRSLA